MAIEASSKSDKKFYASTESLPGIKLPYVLGVNNFPVPSKAANATPLPTSFAN